MRVHKFDPADLAILSVAFNSAWRTVQKSTCADNRDAVREAIGSAIMGLAGGGVRNPSALANYGRYRATAYLDLGV